MATRDEGPTGSVRRLWWPTFLLLLIAGSSWALALPLLVGPDEESHAVRAAALVRGDGWGRVDAG